MCCLHRHQSQRYRTALALADDLARFLDGNPVSARPLHSMQRLGRWALREKRLAAAIGIAFAVRITGHLATSILCRRSAHSEELANEVNAFHNNNVLTAAAHYMDTRVDPSRHIVAPNADDARS